MNIENRINRCLGYGLIALTFLHPMQPIMAATINAKNNQTQVQNINDVPVINIVKPNGAGVSHNQFVDFNVTEKGAILNNSTVAGKSQLAGQINANSNLKGTNAKLIINEVVGNSQSQLQGKTEVFGKQADILIANPNGITCDGCGFINTNAVTLTTGSPSFDKNGAVEALTVTKGTIVIGSKGMDTSNVDYTDIISRATDINGYIRAKNLNFIQGTNKIDYATGKISSIAGLDNKPTVSIDTKALGGMYADTIHIVSTESGAGVNVSNLISTKGDIILAADGKIKSNYVSSANDLIVKGESLGIESSRMTSKGNLVITADEINASFGYIVSDKKLQINANQIYRNYGEIKANDDIQINSDKIYSKNSVIESNNDIRIYSDAVINIKSVIRANNNLWIQKDLNDTRSDSLVNLEGTIKTNFGNLLIRADRADIFESHVFSGKNLYINSNFIQNWDSSIESVNDMFLTGGHFENSLGIKPEDDYHDQLIIRSGNNLIADFNDGIYFNTTVHYSPTYEKKTDVRIASGNNLVLNAHNIYLDKDVDAKGSISMIANNAIGLKNSTISTDKDLNLVAINSLNLSQSRLYADNLSLISRSGDINLKTVLDTDNKIKTFGELNSRNNLDIDAGKSVVIEDQVINVVNNLSIFAGGDVALKNTTKALELSDSTDNIKYLDKANNCVQNKCNTAYYQDIFNKTSHINIDGNATIKSTNNVDIDGVKIKTGQEVNIMAANDIILTPRIIDSKIRTKFLPTESEPELSSIIDATGNIMISVGRDIYSKAATIHSKGNIDLIAGRDFLLPAVAYTINNPNTVKHLHVVTDINAAKKLTVAVNGDLIANGASFTSGGDMQLSAHGAMEFNSVVNSSETQLGKTKTASTTQQNVVLSSGGNLNLISDSSILLQATDLDADKSINAAAKGGFLFAQAMQETNFYESITKKRKWYGKKKTVIKTSHSVVNKVVDFTANDDVTLMSSGDSVYQASQIKAGKDIKLSSTNGKVIFEGVNDSEFNQKIVKSTGFFIKQSDKGYDKTTWRLPVINAGGVFTVDAAQGVSADIIAQKNQSLNNALSLLSNNEGTSWLKGLDKNNNVEWTKVQDAYSSWNYKTESLNPVIAAVIAIAVAVVTSGAGLAAGGAIAGGVGATGTAGAVITQGVAAGFTALSSKAAVSLVENKGNISKTLQDLGRSDSVKSIVTSMIVGGAMTGFDQAFDIGSNANPNTNISSIDSSSKMTLISNGDWDKVAKSVVGHAMIDAGANIAVYGGSFKDRFTTSLLSNVGNQVNAESANWIGHGSGIENYTGKLLSHAASSAIAAEIGRGSGKGAAAGAFAAEFAAIALGDTFKDTKNYRNTMLSIGKVTGAIAGAIIARSPEGVYSGSNAGYLVVENNSLAKPIIKGLEKGYESCMKNATCRNGLAQLGVNFGLTNDQIQEAMDAGNSRDIDQISKLSQEQVAWLDKQILAKQGLAPIMFGSETWGDRLYDESSDNGNNSNHPLAGGGAIAANPGYPPNGDNNNDDDDHNNKDKSSASEDKSQTTSNGYKVSNGADKVIDKADLENPIVQSRINIQNGSISDNKGWSHVVARHFYGNSNASQFTITEEEAKTIIGSNQVRNVPISNTRISTIKGTNVEQKIYERVITLDKNIGVDKFTGRPTNTITILTDRSGNLITATPGRIMP